MNLEAQLYPDVAADRMARALEKQASWNQGLCPWDLNNAAVRQKLREMVGLDDFLALGREWTKPDIAPYAAKARELAPHIKTVLHFSITPEMSDVQVIHQLLSQLGLKIVFRWSRSHPGFEGQKIRVYHLDAQHYQQAIDILERRKRRREAAGQQEQGGSPHRFSKQNSTGDPNQTDPQTDEGWASEENLADVRLWLEAAAADPSDESIAQLLKLIPPDVLRRVKT